jgi:hypothetical protein
MNIQELTARIEALKAENAQKLQEKVTVARLTAQIELEGNEVILEAKAQQALRNEQTERLREVVSVCEGFITQVPVPKARSTDMRVWMGKHRYGYNTQVDLMYELVSGILYSCKEHKELMLAHTGLNMELVEQTMAAFGTPSYYNRNTNTIEEEVPYNVDQVKATLGILQSELGVVIDTSAVTEKAFAKEFERARDNAINNFDQAQEAIAEADFTL